MVEQLFLAFKGKHLVVSDDQEDRLNYAFRHLNVRDYYDLIDAWLDANPRRRPRNQYRFLVNWFQKQPKPNPELRVGCGPSDMGIPIHVNPKVLERLRKKS